MKRYIAALLALVLAFGFSAGALASSTEYAATGQFLDCLQSRGVKYTYDGMSDNGKERVYVIYNGDNKDSIRVDLFFSEDNMYVSLRCWDIIHYSDADFAKVLRVCNKINTDYKYTTFYADESDNTVSASIDIILLEDVDCAELTRENMLRLVNIVDDNFELLAPYDA